MLPLIKNPLNVRQYRKVLLLIFSIFVFLNLASLYAFNFLAVTIGGVGNACLIRLFERLSVFPSINIINSCLAESRFSEVQENAVRLPIVCLTFLYIPVIYCLLLFLFAQRNMLLQKSRRGSTFNIGGVSEAAVNVMMLALPVGSLLLLVDNLYPIMSGWHGLSLATACLPKGGATRFAINNIFSIGLIIGWALFVSRTRRR